MSFKRFMLEIGKSFKASRAGDGPLAPVITENVDAALTVTASMIQGGVISQTTALGADRIYTTDTGPNLADAFPEMDLGDAIPFYVQNMGTGDFDVIMAGGDGVTLKASSGNIGYQSGAWLWLVLTDKTDGAETFDLF